MQQFIHQEIRQQQTLAPRQVQTLRVLAMDAGALREYLREQTLENPAIELTPPPAGSARRAAGRRTDAPAREIAAPSGPTLAEHLLEQLPPGLPARELAVFRRLLGCLDPDTGYLLAWGGELLRLTRADKDTLMRCLRLLRRMEPAGVGARDLGDCLILQARRRGVRDAAFERLAREYLPLLAQGRLPQIAAALGMRVEQTRAYAELIASLSPRPAGGIEAGPVVYVQPDVTLSLEAGRWRVTLHEGGFDIRVSAECAALLRDAHDQETREYLRERIGQARFLQGCVRRRGETLLRLAQCIAQTQSDYLRTRGELAPLTMEDLAARTGLHLSTVSRALKDKTVRTPRGCMPMKGLLCGRPSRREGAAQGVSSAQVKAALGRLLSQEAPGVPLSDEALALRLGEQGVPLSRRTVAKYRQALGIPGAYARAAMRP